MTSRQKAGLPYIVLAAAIFAAYTNVYQNAFVWDDLNLIVNNDSLHHWSGLANLLTKTTNACFYRPIQVLLYFFIYQIFGLSQAAFHGANVLLHAANACLMYWLGCRLGFYKRASFVAALLWGVHPLWSSGVAYASGTSDLLVVFFCMMGLHALLPDFAPRKFWLALLFFILALGSKESAVVFPALVTFTLFLVNKKRLQPATYIRTWPLWLLAAAYITGWLLCPVLNNLSQYGALVNSLYSEIYVYNFTNRTLTSLATLPVYLSLIIWPTDLHMNWASFSVFTTVWNWQVIAGVAIVVIALLQIIWGHGRRGLPLTWGLLWFVAALSPDTGILKPIDGIFAQNWIYLPTTGLFLGVAQMTTIWIKSFNSKKALMLAAGLTALAMLGLGTKTYLQNKILYDAGALFENVLKYNPNLPWVHYELGMYYFERREYKKAAEQLYTAEYYSHDLNKDDAMNLHMTLAFICLNITTAKDGGVSLKEITSALPTSKGTPKAIEELKLAQEVDPNDYAPNLFLSVIYYYLGDKKQGDYYNAMAEKASIGNKLQKKPPLTQSASHAL